MDTKTCIKCGEEKPLESFPIGKLRKDGSRGLRAQCKDCRNAIGARYYAENREARREYGRKYREENPEKAREIDRKYREANREARREYNRIYRKENEESLREYNRRYEQANREARREYNRVYYAENREAKAEHKRRYYAENKEALNEYNRKYRKDNRESLNEYHRDKYANDPLFRLSKICRKRLWDGLKSLSLDKSRPSCEYVGCSWEDLRAHLEGQFVDGMTWENQGEWHIDHIVPLCSATTEEELLKLTHFTNLQPLWAFDNLSKGGRV
jgi:hypothetical protein